MKKNHEHKIVSWKQIKDDVYGELGTERRDSLERDFESFKNDNRMSPNTSFNTIMAGLNCGIPSKNAWEIIKNGCDAVIKISDEQTKKAMKQFYNPIGNDLKIISGESGAAALGGLIKVLDFEQPNDLKKHLNLNQDSKILLFNTEGDTDPDSFKKIVSEFN